MNEWQVMTPLVTAHLPILTAISRAKILERTISAFQTLSLWMEIHRCERCLGVRGSPYLRVVKTTLSLLNTACMSLVKPASAHSMGFAAANLQDTALGATHCSTRSPTISSCALLPALRQPMFDPAIRAMWDCRSTVERPSLNT